MCSALSEDAAQLDAAGGSVGNTFEIIFCDFAIGVGPVAIVILW